MSRAAVSKLRGVVSRILAAPRGAVSVSPPVPFPPLSAASGVSSSGAGASARVSASASRCHARALSTAATFSGPPFGTSGCRLAAVVADNTATSDVSNHIEREMTGLEREELEGELIGKTRFDLEPPRGPFGTKEAPAIIESKFEWRIVGCSGGVGEEEHDVVWFQLKKGQNYECSVCSQVFQLKTIPDVAGGH